jgi:hypothetical protein
MTRPAEKPRSKWQTLRDAAALLLDQAAAGEDLAGLHIKLGDVLADAWHHPNPQPGAPADAAPASWCTRGCVTHWRVYLGTPGVLVELVIEDDDSMQVAYLDPDEADSLAYALHAYARQTRQNSAGLSVFTIESHHPARKTGTE